MTREEKAKKIEEFCLRPFAGGGIKCFQCPLSRVVDGENCYSEGANIDRNYEILFGAELGDPVNKASHYNDGGIECIDAIEASMPPLEYAGFLKGQVLKYVWRYRLKGKPAEDLKKARYYLDRLIQIIEKEATV